MAVLQRSELVTKIRKIVGDENIVRWDDTFIQELINEAIRYLSGELRNNVKTTTIQFTTSDVSKDWPSDFLAVFKAEIDNKVVWKTTADVVRRFSGETGTPYLYYTVGDQVFLYPQTDQTVDLDLTYIATAPELTQDTDTLDVSLGRYADEYVQFKVAAELKLSQNDSDGYTLFKGKADELLFKSISNTFELDSEEYRMLTSRTEDWTYGAERY